MFMVSFFLLILIGFPVSAFAQFIDKGDKVEVRNGTRLCPNVKMTQEKVGSQDPVRVFWVVKSSMRSNGTQSVVALIHEDFYNTKSGDTSIKETVYQEEYATFFKRDPEHKGMLFMISPQHGGIQAVVEVCVSKK